MSSEQLAMSLNSTEFNYRIYSQFSAQRQQSYARRAKPNLETLNAMKIESCVHIGYTIDSLLQILVYPEGTKRVDYFVYYARRLEQYFSSSPIPLLNGVIVESPHLRLHINSFGDLPVFANAFLCFSI